MDKALSDNEELWKQFKKFSETRLPKAQLQKKKRLSKNGKKSLKTFIRKIVPR